MDNNSKEFVYCDIENNDEKNCFTCKNGMITENWCDLKCKLKNHIICADLSKYKICRDYK